KSSINFETRSGTLTAKPHANGIALDLPAIATKPIEYPPLLAEALGAAPVQVHRGRFDYLVELGSEGAVRELSPDLYKLKQIEARGVVVTAKAESGSEIDFVSRGFFPQSGIDEDPVTGSAHCMLAPFWSKRLGKTIMTAYQASKRGGYVGLELNGERVTLIGDAAIVMKGELQT
ncbi:MAG TPA: PhzF family phenazine biosynthesis protein, partial [Candidatus Kapabacteria bacterium]|nr:PhzF family phenazine biosynthesis protein [Candidatus Kapabacteria bacterium]